MHVSLLTYVFCIHEWIYIVGISAPGLSVSEPANKTAYYAALGENLVVTCQAEGHYQGSLTWRKGETSVNQSIHQCNGFHLYNSSCTGPISSGYDGLRVRSHVYKARACKRQVRIFSGLEISVTNWTDNGLSYGCVARANEYSDIEEVYLIDVIVG